MLRTYNRPSDERLGSFNESTAIEHMVGPAFDLYAIPSKLRAPKSSNSSSGSSGSISSDNVNVGKVDVPHINVVALTGVDEDDGGGGNDYETIEDVDDDVNQGGGGGGGGDGEEQIYDVAGDLRAKPAAALTVPSSPSAAMRRLSIEGKKKRRPVTQPTHPPLSF